MAAILPPPRSVRGGSTGTGAARNLFRRVNQSRSRSRATSGTGARAAGGSGGRSTPAPPSAVGSGARAAGLGSSIRNITNSTAGGGIRAGARAAGPRPRGEVYRQSFSDMLPYDEFVDEDRIREMAYSRVDPEIERQRAEALRALMAQISQGGTYRFGRAPILQQQLMDMYGRRREEMALPFMQAGQQTLGDYYNTLESEYYRDPLNFGVPTQFDYSKILGF